MTDTAMTVLPIAAPRVEYQRLERGARLPENLLAAVTFGSSSSALGHDDPRVVRVGLTPLYGGRYAEMWYANGPVTAARAGAIHYAADADYLFGALELDEQEYGGIADTTREAYQMIRRFLGMREQPHLLRVWNHFDAINRGAGNAERYRRFCVGRAAALEGWLTGNYPAATAIGRRDGDTRLQIYWLSGRTPGVALENPRQVNPWDYPKAYGPTSPQFSRGMLVGGELALVSGTASILGHASHHENSVEAQLDESLANLGNVLGQAGVGAQLREGSVLRVYLRNEEQMDLVEERLRERLPPGVRYFVLTGDICRNDLLIEIEGVQKGG